MATPVAAAALVEDEFIGPVGDRETLRAVRHETDLGLLDRYGLVGPRRPVALHVRVVAPVLANAALVELRPSRGAVRVGGALAVARFGLDAVIGEILCALPDKIDCGRLRGEKYFGAA